MEAEMIFASFIIEHNMPITSTKYIEPIFCASIAKKYTSAVIKSIAHFTQNEVDTLKNNPSKSDSFPKKT